MAAADPASGDEKFALQSISARIDVPDHFRAHQHGKGVAAHSLFAGV